MTYTFTTTSTFTRTSARYITSKVMTDLRRMNSYYGRPTETEIEDYYAELVELLALGFVESVEYGFRQDGRRIISLFYPCRIDNSLEDDRAGGVYARADITGASWFSFLTYNGRWSQLSESERARIEAGLPIRRTTGQAPQDGNGYWITDRRYSADGVGVQRRTFRPY